MLTEKKEPETSECRKFEDFMRELFKRAIDCWEEGEGQIEIEITSTRQGKEGRWAVIKGGPIRRIG